MRALVEARAATGAAVLVAMFCTFAAPAMGRSVILSPDAVYFPDQVEYLRASHGKCGRERVYWPGDGRCYAENEQGPCPFGFLLRWEEVRLRPLCSPDPAVRLDGRISTPDLELRGTSSLLSFRPYADPSDSPSTLPKNNMRGHLGLPKGDRRASQSELVFRF